MGRGVPEWMNSSLWSSFDDRHLVNHTSSSSSPSTPPEETGAGSALKQPNPKPSTVQPHDPPPPRKTTTQPSPSPADVSASSSSISRSSRPDRTAGSVDALPPSPEDISRRARFIGELSKKVVDLGELRRLAAEGVPDSCGIRPVVWKILLGYLPCNREIWAEELSRKRSQYAVFKEEVLVNPSELARRLERFNGFENEKSNHEGKGMLPRSNITHGEHPLSLGKASVWNKYFQDSEIIEQIDRDVKRTHPDMHFFSGDSPSSKSNQETLKSILMVFAKLNPGIRYVQGMNEILAPIFYIFRTEQDGESEVQAEADSFFCFVELMSGLRDHFCQQLDKSVVGIRSTMTRLTEILRKHDEELWRHLEITTKVNPQFYAFRWITLLLTQEFNFTDSLRIWDMLLSDPDGPLESLLRVCCAMLILIRRRLLAGDFTSNLKLLQHYPWTNIEHLLYVADKLQSQPIVSNSDRGL